MSAVTEEAARGSRHTSGVLFFLFSTLLGALVFMPFGVHVVDFEPDLSLRMMFHEAFARRLQYGHEVIYTYGPWSILEGGYDPRTSAIVFTVTLFFALVFGWTATAFARARGIGNAAALLATATIAALFASTGYDIRYFGLIVVLLLWNTTEIEERDERSWLARVPLVAAVALIALIKFSFFVTATVVIVAMLLRAKRSSAKLGVTYVLALAAAWLAAGQHASTFLPFVTNAMQIAAGYAAAAGSSPTAGAHELAIALLTSLGIIIYALAAERARAGIVHIAALACVLFLILKTSFVRYDVAHSSTAMTLLMIIAIILLGATLGHRTQRTARIAGTTLVIIQLAMLATSATSLLENARAALAYRANAASQHAHYHAELATLSHAAVLPDLHGTVDAYMWGSAALMWRNFAYTPRPVFQSYMAWTAALAAMNAAHLREHPRQWLVMDVRSIDERLEALDDAPSWLEIVTRYDLNTTAGDSLILSRRVTPFRFALAPIATFETRIGTTIVTPDSDAPLWCSVDMRPSLIGTLRGTLLRPSRVQLDYTSGASHGHADVVPAMIRGGFLLSPLVRDNAAFARLMQRAPVPPDARIRTIRIAADDAADFDPRITVHISRVMLKR
jgi:hypothetical protein